MDASNSSLFIFFELVVRLRPRDFQRFRFRREFEQDQRRRDEFLDRDSCRLFGAGDQSIDRSRSQELRRRIRREAFHFCTGGSPFPRTIAIARVLRSRERVFALRQLGSVHAEEHCGSVCLRRHKANRLLMAENLHDGPSLECRLFWFGHGSNRKARFFHFRAIC